MRRYSLIACIALLLACAGAASAIQTNVAILSGLGSAGLNNDVVSKITANAPFLNITVFDVANVAGGTPDVATLEGYKAVMVIGGYNSTFDDAVGLGNSLRTYIDDGFSVVITALSNTSSSCGGYSAQLCGAFNTLDYWALEPGSRSWGNHATLNTLTMTGPIFTGVTSFDGGFDSGRINTTKNSNATVVANWSDGTPFAATRTFVNGNKQALEIGLNFYPPSSSAGSDYWLNTTDGGKILANAFTQAATYNSSVDAGDVPEPSTYLIVGGGLALIGLLLRRRPGTLQCESVQRLRQR